MSYPTFAESPVPVSVASRVLGMNPNTVRNLMESKAIDIGFIVTKKQRGKRTYRNTYISPKKFFELTGYVWKGDQNERD